MKSKRYQIYCLQDTHFTGASEKIINTQWNGQCFFSFSKSNARGVAILFSKDFEYKIHSTITDMDGNFIILDLTAENNRFTLTTLYAPNLDKPDFFEHLFRNSVAIGNNSMVFCGDFNLVQDPDMEL